MVLCTSVTIFVPLCVQKILGKVIFYMTQRAQLHGLSRVNAIHSIVLYLSTWLIEYLSTQILVPNYCVQYHISFAQVQETSSFLQHFSSGGCVCTVCKVKLNKSTMTIVVGH